MSKVKYYYDSETLSYRKVERKKSHAFGKVLIFITASLLMGLLFTIAVFNFAIDTEREIIYSCSMLP